MRNFSIDLIWAKIQIAITAIGGWLGYFLGGIDGLMIALMIFMALDYVTGVMCAIIDKKLSSAVGFKGVCKKVLILFMVGIANIVDLHVIGSGSALRGAVIAFYLSNEGLSLGLREDAGEEAPLDTLVQAAVYRLWRYQRRTNRCGDCHRVHPGQQVAEEQLFRIGRQNLAGIAQSAGCHP